MFQTSSTRKIFGIGLPKTGTTSLSKALEELGYSSIHYPKDLEEIKHFDSATDSLVAVSYEYLDNEYPCSKFILTTRDMNEWLESVRNHEEKLVTPKPGTRAYELRVKSLGTADYNKSILSNTFKDHERDINRYFKERPNDLLTLNFSDTVQWDQLCDFLGISDYPNTPFPKANVASTDSINHAKKLNDKVNKYKSH